MEGHKSIQWKATDCIRDTVNGFNEGRLIYLLNLL